MFDKLISSKEIEYKGVRFIFKVWRVSGCVVYVNEKYIPMFFDINNDKKLKNICDTLVELMKYNNIYPKQSGVVTEEMKEKLNDFETLLEIINKNIKI